MGFSRGLDEMKRRKRETKEMAEEMFRKGEIVAIQYDENGWVLSMTRAPAKEDRLVDLLDARVLPR